MPSISIVISYYKALGDLKLILKALNQQSKSDFEVIISEDDTTQNTKKFNLGYWRENELI